MAIGPSPYRLPPMNALKMFESSARHLNFRLAADEIGLTQGAVAQQVRGLEEFLGAKLFNRLPRGLELTEAGRRYLKPVQRALTLISEATEQQTPSKTTLTISVTPSFAAKWLVPHLHRIAETNAQLEIHVLATNALANFQSDGVDIAVRHTKPPFGPGLRGELLFPATIMAVCSPQFVTRNPISNASDLVRNVLLHDAHGLWPVFLERAGVPDDLRETKSLKFSHTSLAIDAAIASQGIALASEELVAEDVVAGRLVSPLDFRLREDLGFYIVYPRSSRKAEHVQWMKEWLLEEKAIARSNAPDLPYGDLGIGRVIDDEE